MTKIFGTEKPSLDDTLEHHGVKGQKWGVRKQPHSPQTRSQRRASYNQERNKAIDKARSDIRSGKTARDFQAAKAKRKIERATLGRSQARKNFRKAKQKRAMTVHDANLVKSGAERTAFILGTAGGIAVSTGINAALDRRSIR